MKLLHTADWHLGQTLHGVSRRVEHDRFLEWLLGAIAAESADALIIAGDVFDVASPSSEAQQAYYDFLAECRRRFPRLDVVVVGGNHDSPARLDAPADLLGALGITVIGGMPDRLEKMIVPLHDAKGVAAWCIAVPFLRPRDLIDDHRALYRRLTDEALKRRTRGQAIVATGHCYMADGIVSELSERKIQVGNQEALSEEIFPEELTYVALGHLHRAQRVAGRNRIRYSGSPIPLSLVERSYDHQVLVIELDGERLATTKSLYVPRTIEILVIPEQHKPIEEVLPLLTFLPRDDGSSPDTRPFLEVRIKIESANPRLRQEVEAALEGARARLLRIDVQKPELHREQAVPSLDLDAISPIDVFAAAHRRQRGADPPEHLLSLFRELEEAIQRGEIA
jgi:DNA repair protein SbcD/Mre11